MLFCNQERNKVLIYVTPWADLFKGAPEKHPHLKPTVEVEDSIPDKTVGMKAIQTSRSDLSADPVLETASEKEQERPDGRENNHPQDKVILQTCIQAEKRCETQNKEILHVEKKTQEPEINKECDREDDHSVYSGLPSMPKDEEMWLKQGKLEGEKNLILNPSELKQKTGEICKKYKIAPDPKGEPLHAISKEGTTFKEIPSAGNKKVRNPLVTFDVKEDQVFDLPMAKTTNQNTSNCKLDIGHTPRSSNSENRFELWHARSRAMKHMIQTKRHDVSSVTNTCKETKPIQGSFQKPLSADNDSTNNDKSMAPELGNVSSPSPGNFQASKVYLNEEFHQHMTRFSDKICKLHAEFLEKKVRLQKQVEEEKKQHRSSEMEVSENIPDAAAAGLIQQGKNGKTDNRQFPMIENEESDRKKLRKDENEKQTSPESATTQVFEKAHSLTGGLQQMNGGSRFSEKTQDDGRPAKKIINKKNKVQKQINTIDDLDDLSQSSKTEASEDFESPASNHNYCMLLIEQLRTDLKEAVKLIKGQDETLSSERRMKTKLKTQFKSLVGQVKKMEEKTHMLQKELERVKERNSQLEHEKHDWERQVSTLRCNLKEEEAKRRNSAMLSETCREELRKKQEKYTIEMETKKQIEDTHRTRDIDLEIEECRKKLDPVWINKLLDMLNGKYMAKYECTMLRLERDRRKMESQIMEKSYCEEIELLKDQNDRLLKTLKLSDKILRKTRPQNKGELNDLTDAAGVR